MPQIERLFYGMVNGSIIIDKTAGVNQLLCDESIECIRTLPIEANNRYLIFWKEEVVAFPKIIKVFDEKSKRGWIQNETRMASFKDYFELTNIGLTLWRGEEFTEVSVFPDQFNSIVI